MAYDSLFNYFKLVCVIAILAFLLTSQCRAVHYLHENEKCLFIATNTDATFPVEGALLAVCCVLQLLVCYLLVLLSRYCEILHKSIILLFIQHHSLTTSLTLRQGGGTIVSAVQRGCGRKPQIMGKPHHPMMEAIKGLGVDVSRAMMIGDRLNTDIAFGHLGGMKTLLV